MPRKRVRVSCPFCGQEAGIEMWTQRGVLRWDVLQSCPHLLDIWVDPYTPYYLELSYTNSGERVWEVQGVYSRTYDMPCPVCSDTVHVRFPRSPSGRARHWGNCDHVYRVDVSEGESGVRLTVHYTEWHPIDVYIPKRFRRGASNGDGDHTEDRRQAPSRET